MPRKNPYPGVTRAPDRHGKTRWRFRSKGFSTYLPGPYGSVDFIAAYEAALQGVKSRNTHCTPATHGSFEWLIRNYRNKPSFKDKTKEQNRTRDYELEWIRERIGQMPFSRFEVKHVEALTGQKEGPAAANKIKKRLSALFNHAIRLGLVANNPARLAERRKENEGGFYTWTDADIEAFRAHWSSGSKPRLALELCLNTGAARQDLARLGWQNIEAGKISYSRGKTGQRVPPLPILPELSAELIQAPEDQILFVTHSNGRSYQPTTIASWFKDCAVAAGVTAAGANIHGLRKAGATRLAEAGASENEIAAYLGHKNTQQAAIYTAAARRETLTDSGFAKLAETKKVVTLSNLSKKLGK